MTLSERALRDLNDLAMDRIEAAFASVAQLMEDDNQVTHLLCCVLAKLALKTAGQMRDTVLHKDGRPLGDMEAYITMLKMLADLRGIESTLVTEEQFNQTKKP